MPPLPLKQSLSLPGKKSLFLQHLYLKEHDIVLLQPENCCSESPSNLLQQMFISITATCIFCPLLFAFSIEMIHCAGLFSLFHVFVLVPSSRHCWPMFSVGVFMTRLKSKAKQIHNSYCYSYSKLFQSGLFAIPRTCYISQSREFKAIICFSVLS